MIRTHVSRVALWPGTFWRTLYQLSYRAAACWLFFFLLWQVIDLQQKLGIKVSGASPPKPVSSFGHFGFDEALLKAIRKSEFTQPTPIQASRSKYCIINFFCYLLPKQCFSLFLICALQQMTLLGLFLPPYAAASVCFEPTSLELQQA